MSAINPKFKTLEDEISSANKRESGCLVKRSAHGFGVFAKRCFDKGELVFSASCLTESERNVHSIQIDWNKYVAFETKETQKKRVNRFTLFSQTCVDEFAWSFHQSFVQQQCRYQK